MSNGGGLTEGQQNPEDNFLGIGLPDYKGDDPPGLLEVARAIRSIEELAAACQPIVGASNDLGQTGAILRLTVNSLDGFEKTGDVTKKSLISLCETFAKALDDRDSDIDIQRCREQFGNLYNRTQETMWPLAVLAPRFEAFGEACRTIGEASPYLKGLLQIAERSQTFANHAQRTASFLRSQQEVADGISQLTALVEFIGESGGVRATDEQMQQARDLSAEVHARFS